MTTRRTIEQIEELYKEPQDNVQTLKRVASRYAVSLTESVIDTIKSADDPVGLQYLPDVRELVTDPEENYDPIGDEANSPLKGLVHRYPDRVLLMPVTVCAVYCRFCFRREMVGPQDNQNLSQEELDTALSYIRDHKDIYEVILTGGDPLILGPRKMAYILEALEGINHVKVVRIHSRVPVAAPERIGKDMLEVLRREKQVYVSVHINHVQEITETVEQTWQDLQDAGCLLISQTVLLRRVNDNVETLETLFRALVERGVKPYYLHHPDLARGTGHFRLSFAEGKEIYAGLRGRLSGLALPQYVVDIPGGFGKVPVTADYVREENGQTILTDPSGKEHIYPVSSTQRKSTK